MMNSQITKLRPSFVPPILSPADFENYTQYERIGILVSMRDNSEANEPWLSSITHSYGHNNDINNRINNNNHNKNAVSHKNNCSRDSSSAGNMSLFGGSLVVPITTNTNTTQQNHFLNQSPVIYIYILLSMTKPCIHEQSIREKH